MLAKWTPAQVTERGIARSAQMPSFDALFREANWLLDGTLADSTRWPGSAGAPPTDIYETADQLVLTMDLPGFDPKRLSIQVEADVLTVQAQRATQQTQHGTWRRQERTLEQVARSFVLPNTVDASKCEATFEHGVLTLALPKREEAKARSITVKVQG